eukprot:6196410-Pleurochrysis_carterae.AAC.2
MKSLIDLEPKVSIATGAVVATQSHRADAKLLRRSWSKRSARPAQPSTAVADDVRTTADDTGTTSRRGVSRETERASGVLTGVAACCVGSREACCSA